MASRPDETIAAQEYANSVPHLDLLQKKRREIDAEIKQTETTQEDAMKILRKCVPELHDTKIYTVSGDALLVITHIAAAGDKNVLFKITKPENMPIKKPQQPMASPYDYTRGPQRPTSVVRNVADEILARLPADMKAPEQPSAELVAAEAEASDGGCNVDNSVEATMIDHG